MKDINRVRGQNAEVSNVRTGEKYSNRWALTG